MRRAHAHLAKRGIPLVSNQVEYSLIHRSPAADGILDACTELNVTLIAYSPLGRGVLSGKYRPGASVQDVRRFYRQFGGDQLEKIMPIIAVLEEIGGAHDKSPAQVTLNWLARQPHVLPISGVKNARQAESNASAIGWEMSAAESARLDEVSLSFHRAEPYRIRPA